MHSVALSQTVGQLVVDLEYKLNFNEFMNKHTYKYYSVSLINVGMSIKV